jgi:hypothetical protein
MIPASTIASLMCAGRARELVPEVWREVFYDLKDQHKINRLTWMSWDAAVKTLDDSELSNLIYGLALCEREFHWLGGSVSAVVWTFKALRRRRTSESNTLEEWLLQNSLNPYVPYGSLRDIPRRFVPLPLFSATEAKDDVL